jgi:spermidine/putrescine transport system ATP-binding protein
MQEPPGLSSASSAGAARATVEPAVELQNVSRRFGETTALAGVTLSVKRGEFLSLLGPSGCGKTTLLRLIAGLDLPDSGTIRISGRDATYVPAHLRPVNTVFQSYALFPHMTVRENISFGLRMKKVNSSERERRVADVMDLVQISELAGRTPPQLSGGQKQRVALARAVVNEPEVLLLDEPLAALDLKLRKQLQVELRSLQRRLQMTFVYVTHDQEEALVMSDRIAVMNSGRIEQLGGSAAVYERPRTRFAAEFLGSCNLLRSTIDRSSLVRAAFGWLECDAASGRPAGAACTLAVRPERISVLAGDTPRRTNCFPATVVNAIYTGSETQYELDCSGVLLTARSMNAGLSASPIAPGQKVLVEIPAASLVLLDE